jgi:cellulose synthase/poly-beta-1,6-N-acetylglucosamine synthase-like glycosyltransferase
MDDPWRIFPIPALMFFDAVLIILHSALYYEMIPRNSFYASRPPVSIIVPNFEKGKYLARALASAAQQTLTEIEIVIVDDSSRDCSMPVVASFFTAIPAFALLLIKNH